MIMPILTPKVLEQQIWTNELQELVSKLGHYVSNIHVSFDLDGWGYVHYKVRELGTFDESVRPLTQILVVLDCPDAGVLEVMTRDAYATWIMSEVDYDDIQPKQPYAAWLRAPIKELEPQL